MIWTLRSYEQVTPIILSPAADEEISIKDVADAIVKAVGFEGEYTVCSVNRISSWLLFFASKLSLSYYQTLSLPSNPLYRFQRPNQLCQKTSQRLTRGITSLTLPKQMDNIENQPQMRNYYLKSVLSTLHLSIKL